MFTKSFLLLFHICAVFILLSSSSSVSVAASTTTINIGKQYKVIATNSTPGQNTSIEFLFLQDNSNNLKKGFWCATNTSLSSVPTTQMARFCSALSMELVRHAENNTADVTIIDKATASSGLTDSNYFKDVSCLDSTSATPASCTASLFSDSSSCSHVYEFYCNDYAPAVDSFSAQSYFFTSQKLDEDDGLLLYRPSSSKPYGTVCGVGSTDPKKIEDTARALCGMQGYGRWKGVSFKSDSPPSGKSMSDYTEAFGNKVSYISNLVCPPYALGIENCTYDISFTANSSLACDGGTKMPLRVRCAVPTFKASPALLRNAPTGKLESRLPCSTSWYSVCDDYADYNVNSVAICRIMSYNIDVSRASDLSPPISENVGSTSFEHDYKSITSDTFLLDDIRCPDPRENNITKLSQCNFRLGREDCSAPETIFMTPTLNPAKGSQRTEELCGGWRNLIDEYHPFSSSELTNDGMEECPPPSTGNTRSSYSDLYNLQGGFGIFVIVVCSLVGGCYCMCCFGCSQYEDRECCERYDSCCEHYCDDMWDFCFSRTICLHCCLDDDEEAAEYCCQGASTLFLNCVNHHVAVICCDDQWNATHQTPEGPRPRAALLRERELALQNEHNEREMGIAGAENAEDEIQIRDNNNNADEAEREAGLSLKPAEVSSRYAMEQEAREVVDKYLLDIANNNISLANNLSFDAVAAAMVAASPLLGENNNSNTNQGDETTATTKNPLSGTNRQVHNDDDDVIIEHDADDDDDEQTATQFTATAAIGKSSSVAKFVPDSGDVIEVPFSLARWWTRDFVAELNFRDEIFSDRSRANAKQRLKMLFGKTARFYCAYESFQGKFSFLICVAKEHTTHNNITSPLPPPYRSRIFEIARATNQKLQKEENPAKETSERSHEPIDDDDNYHNAEDEKKTPTVFSPPTNIMPPQSTASSAAAAATSAFSTNDNHDSVSITSFHFYRLIDFCRLLKLSTSTNFEEMLSLFGPSFQKMNPKLLFEADEPDSNTDASNSAHGEASTCRTETVISGMPSREASSVLEDDLDGDRGNGLVDDDDSSNNRNKLFAAATSSASASSGSKFNKHHHQEKQEKKEIDPTWGLRCSICFARFYVDFPLTRGRSIAAKNQTSAPAQTIFPGVECSSPGRHFTCSNCIGNTVSRFIEKGDVIFSSLPCYNGDCAQALGAIVLNDFSSVLELSVWRKWHDAMMERARLVGQREIMRGGPMTRLSGSADARGQAEKIREILKPKCPKCEMPFMSFSGCVQVKCIIGTSRRENLKNSEQKKKFGCGTVFCGACLKPQPCGTHGSHDFLSPAELHKAWAKWRREKVVTFLQENFAPKSAAARDVIVAAQNYLVAGGIWPLDAPWNLE